MVDMSAEDFCAIAAVNDDGILADCLARSPDIVSGRLPLKTVRGVSSMAHAYNQGLDMAPGKIAILVHQDVYLPAGWLDHAVAILNALTLDHPDWMVAGPYGVRDTGEHIGRVWDVNLRTELGATGFPATPVGSLDELLLILRREPEFRFDPALPHFHLYGTDLVQSARAMGRGAFAVELPVVHNNRPWDSLGGGYRLAYRYVRHKWRDRLPIHTTICPISRNPLPLWRAQWGRRHVTSRGEGVLADSVDVARAADYERRS